MYLFDFQFSFFYILKIRKKKDKKYRNLKKASKIIKKILDENERIFKSHWPNSSSSNISDLRNENQLKAWHSLKLKNILPNNDKIYNVLNNITQYDSDELETVEKMKNHIEAFKKHLSDADYDYSEHQFPIKFSSLISKYCNWGLLNNKYYKDYLAWINKYITENWLNFTFKGLFWSVLYFKNPSDIDLLLYSENDYNREDYANLNILAIEFKKNFNKKLDINFYSNKEKKEFKKFKEQILDIKEF